MNRFEAINCISYQIGNLKALRAAMWRSNGKDATKG